LAYNEEEHEELREAYLEYLKWTNELESTQKSFENLIGKSYTDENGNTRYKDGHANEVLSEIDYVKDRDDAFEYAVEQVF
jgi:hypothetical protein